MVQKLDEAKRNEILDVAARLFANRPFHEVKLDEVAAEARVGKGTLYGYFASKEDLHHSLVLRGFELLTESVRGATAEEIGKPWDRLGHAVRRLVAFSRTDACLLKIMRNAYLCGDARLEPHRDTIHHLLSGLIAEGIERGEMHDPRPDLTAEYILACVRGVQLHGPKDLSETEQTEHLIAVLGSGLLTTPPRH